MRRGLLYAGLAALVLSGDDSESVWTAPPAPAPGGGGGMPGTRRASLAAWLGKSGIPSAWQSFLLFVAAGESGFNIAATNSSSGEARAAKKAYDRNLAKLAGCGHAEADYVFGSGGLFGFLAPYGPLNLPTGMKCLNPITVMRSPELSITAAVNFARYLKGASSSDTVVSLRAGWGWPAKINDAERLANRRPVYQARARKLGWPASYVDSVLPPLTVTPEQAYANLTAVVA